MPGWTTIPPWLYQNTLSDADLRRVYVEGARRKVLDLRAERDRHPAASREWRRLDGLLAGAEDFLQEAEAAPARYAPGGGQPASGEAEEPRRPATVREVPKLPKP
jgi:hypothetical protein